MLITALCVLGCSAIAFRVGYGLRRDVIMVRLELFFHKRYDAITAEQDTEWKSAYCRGAVDMFNGLIAELGMKVIKTKKP